MQTCVAITENVSTIAVNGTYTSEVSTPTILEAEIIKKPCVKLNCSMKHIPQMHLTK